MGHHHRAIGRKMVVSMLVAAGVAAGCGGSTGSASSTTTPPAATAPQDKAITSFAFLSSDNPIPITSVGTITGTSISVFLPPGTNRSGLTATFTAPPEAVVKVGSVNQISGVTANDFAGPVEYTVQAADGSTATFVVTVTTDIASIDSVVKGFMTTYNVPGLSLAITRNENLVYVKAYGRADDKRQASSIDLYRIASLSKQLTSVALMRLVDQSRLSLNDKVFGAGAILGTRYGTQPYGPGITDITVDQLLHHTGGGWTNDGADPMFTNPAMSVGDLISWTLDNRPLTHPPGTFYAYSNFGYAVLGRVIEQITGLPYADAVRLLVLQPAGVSDMAIAGNTLADRLPTEVEYFSQGNGNPYAFNISRMDAHGGWLASATDLAKFLVRVDGLPGKTDILSADAIRVMTTGSAVNPNYAAGWSVNGQNWWHTGGLPGTATEQARTTSSGNYNFVILTNTESQSPTFFADMDQLFWKALQATSAWPSYDLFTPNGGSS